MGNALIIYDRLNFNSENQHLKRLNKNLSNTTRKQIKAIKSANTSLYLYLLQEVKLVDIPTDTKLGRDLEAYSKKFGREVSVSNGETFEKKTLLGFRMINLVSPVITLTLENLHIYCIKKCLKYHRAQHYQ